MGQVKSGYIEIAGRKFSTLVTLFEILPPPGLLDLMQRLVQSGGRVIWSGPPPLLAHDGQVCLPEWQELFGVKMPMSVFWGDPAPGKMIHFENELAKVPAQTILTDFLVDRIYPVESVASQPVARADNQVIGTLRQSGSGWACFLGFRPRDDQAASLGHEERVFFEILNALGAYPATGKFAEDNDNTEFLSRTTAYLNTRFPNGVTVVAGHYRAQRENWPGGFARDRESDLKIVQENPLPSDRLQLENYRVNGHEVTFDGRLIVAFNVDADGDLTAFAGQDCRQITVDGRTIQFSTERLPRIAWAPVAANRRVPGGAVLHLFFEGTGSVAIPFFCQSRHLKLIAEGKTPGSRGEQIAFSHRNQTLQITLNAGNTGRWLYLCE